MYKCKMEPACDMDLESLLKDAGNEAKRAPDPPVTNTAVEGAAVGDECAAFGTELDDFLKEVVEKVKNSVLSSGPVKVEQGVIGEWKRTRRNATSEGGSVIGDDGCCRRGNGGGERPEVNGDCRGRVVGLEEEEEEEDVVEEEEEDKVNVIDSDGRNGREDEDLNLFNSHNYWYFSPEMPLDPSIIAGGPPADDRNSSGELGVSTVRLRFFVYQFLYYVILAKCVRSRDSCVSLKSLLVHRKLYARYFFFFSFSPLH